MVSEIHQRPVSSPARSRVVEEFGVCRMAPRGWGRPAEIDPGRTSTLVDRPGRLWLAVPLADGGEGDAGDERDGPYRDAAAGDCGWWEVAECEGGQAKLAVDDDDGSGQYHRARQARHEPGGPPGAGEARAGPGGGEGDQAEDQAHTEREADEPDQA